jgi:hypothetical protein
VVELLNKLLYTLSLEDHYRPKAFVLIFIYTILFLYFGTNSQDILLEGVFYSVFVWLLHLFIMNASGGKLIRRCVKGKIYAFIREYNHNLGQSHVYKEVFVPDPKNLYQLVIDSNPHTVSVLANKYIEILRTFEDMESNEMIHTLTNIQQNAERIHLLSQRKTDHVQDFA